MDKKDESNLKLEILAEKCEKLKKEFSEQKNLHFFDLLIDCGNIILPAHKFVLCSRSDVLAQQLSPDVNELNWTDYGSDLGIALIRWIYTNKVHFNNVTVPIGFSSVSHQSQSTTVFDDWQHLLSLVNEGTNDETIIKYHNIGKIVGSDRLVAKCLELRPNCFFSSVLKSQQVKVNHQANANLHGCDTQMEVDTEMEQRVNDLAEEVKKFEKISFGCREFGTFSDLTVRMDGLNWSAHEYFLSNRSKNIRDENSDIRIYGETPAFLRWLYTDVLELESVDAAIHMLYISRDHKLPTLFEQCEEALLKKVDITSCVKFFKTAKAMGTTKILRRCQELIKCYGKVLHSEGSLKVMGVDFDNSGEHSSCERETCELPLEGAVGLLDLNDDCFFHLFRYLPLVDLGSIKDTCKRLSQLADQSFKLRKDKSITIQEDSMLADIWNLTHFGKLMHSLAVNSVYKEFASLSKIFQIIAKNEQFKAFTVDLCDVADESIQYLEKVLKNVETIKLVSRYNSGHIDLILGYGENLRDVDIETYMPINIKALCCSKNVNITCLALKYMRYDQMLVQICEKLPNLECFEFSSSEFSSNNMSCLSQLDHLKRLKIECANEPKRIGNALQKFAEENHLEYLCLSGVIVCEALAQTLGHFQNLKELVFGLDSGLEGDAKNILSKTLANVEKIAFVGCYASGFDVEAYEFGDVTQIVENLLNLKELSVYSKYRHQTFIDSNNYLRLTKNQNRGLEIFLKDSDYKGSIACIGNDLSKYVRVTARPHDFFAKLCCPKVMN